jgi:hypothetical protein
MSLLSLFVVDLYNKDLRTNLEFVKPCGGQLICCLKKSDCKLVKRNALKRYVKL